MATILQTDLPTILQQVEQQLLSYVSPVTGKAVAGDISNIYWIFPEEEPDPGTTGQRDLIFAIHEDEPINREGDGRFAKYKSGFDVYLRTSLVSDRPKTKRDWLLNHRPQVNAMIDSLDGFFPQDMNGNAYTIEGLVLKKNAKPEKQRDSQSWGKTIASFEFHYLPNINVPGIL